MLNLDEIENDVWDELKDFQKETVKRIDFLYKNGQKRILVSDEVGLGKTRVAKGVIAKFAKLREKEGDNLIKVLYICSNSTIADQNLESLRINDEIEIESSFTSRLSMQHYNIFRQENQFNKGSGVNIQLIPLTPETSFDITNSQGTAHERALMFAILKRNPFLEKKYEKCLRKIFSFGVNNWGKYEMEWEFKVGECYDDSNGEYEKLMFENISKRDINKLIKFCDKIQNNKIPDGDFKKQAKPVIVKFRKIFANISLKKLNADLIIMDEFQRFNSLITADVNSELGQLVKILFNSDARILLLSATPYKLYSTLDEISKDDVDAHYEEFFDLIKFLKNDENEKIKFEEIWEDYSIKLRQICDDKDAFLSVKSEAENELYKNICRTERITEKDLADIFDVSDVENHLSVLEEDINLYIEMQRLLDDTIGGNVPIEYIKSTPYLMSFMNSNYKLKNDLENYFSNHPDEINKVENDIFWLNENSMRNYEKISLNNARLSNLMENLLKGNESNLLWVPPSIPYYELSGVFKDLKNFSKTLIFSSWEMVPRMISSLVSYEVERQTIGSLDVSDRKRNIRRRYYSSKNNYLQRHNIHSYYYEPDKKLLFMLMYPSYYLSNLFNPIDCFKNNLTLNEIEIDIKTKLKIKLDKISCVDEDDEDSNWYYLAPFLLDSKSHVNSWFEQFEKYINPKEFGSEYIGYFDSLKELYDDFNSSKVKLGKKPKDLVDVLCDMAIASPTICAYRSYENELPLGGPMENYLIPPTEIGRKFVNLMLRSLSTAIINLNFKNNSRDEYWKNVLKYSKEGNLQAVFDEYVHLISNSANSKDKLLKINKKFLAAFEFRTSYLKFDTINSFSSSKRNRLSLRTHYATSFVKSKGDEPTSNRKKNIIDAFNSPFRPFVLTSTSIGQEGLDFHNYCRKIVHWNLPSNPIDLEQREGRINRFKCLAIRQNIAKRYGQDKKQIHSKNIWNDLFDFACKNEGENSSDLIPYWGLKPTGDMIRIERFVPKYPFSSDENNYEKLIKILSLYRLTLGQPRQEELLKSTLTNLDEDEENLKKFFINLSPYYKEGFEDSKSDCE